MPLHHCAKNGFVEFAKLLVVSGAQVNSKTNKGKTPLHFAAYFNKIDMVEFLIDKGAQIEATRGKVANTPLLDSVARGHFEIVEFLIEIGAQIDARNSQNENAIDIANHQGHNEISKYLLEKKKESKANAPEENLSSKALCIICWTPRNEIFALLPCGHTTLCEPCCFKLKKRTDSNCPSCRKPITDYMKIFFQEPEIK